MVHQTLQILTLSLGSIETLKIIGLSTVASQLTAGFGYSSLLVGWTLKEVLLDVLSGFALIFSDVVKEGAKINVGGQQYDVVKCGMRDVRIRRVRDGEIEHVPNSKIVGERVINYQGWERRRCQVNVVVKGDTKADDIEGFKREVEEGFGEFEGVVKSDPCCYCAGFTKGGGVALEVVYYIEDYHDDIGRFKRVNDRVVILCKRVLERRGIGVCKGLVIE